MRRELPDVKTAITVKGDITQKHIREKMVEVEAYCNQYFGEDKCYLMLDDLNKPTFATVIVDIMHYRNWVKEAKEVYKELENLVETRKDTYGIQLSIGEIVFNAQ